MFTFTPLLGAQSTSKAQQSILELDGGVKVLVDVGWDESFNTRQLAELEKHISTLSFILLTHATISHLGAFAHCCKHVPIFTQIPVYATSPVIAFGRTLLQDLYSSAPSAATFIPNSATSNDDTIHGYPSTNILRQAPTFEEINKYFSLITPLKYSQPLQPSPSQFSAPLEGLTLTAYNSGHTLGGTIWHIQHGMESIVYAVDWNQARENVVAGAAWFGGVGGSEVLEQLRKPTALVCSSTGADEISPLGGRKARDNALLGHIRGCISKGGVALIPTDSSARILELAWILEKTLQEASEDSVFKTARVYMASRSANATLRHARSLLEWMDDSIVREFEGEDDATTNRNHQRSGSKQTNGISKSSRPFEFRHVKIIEKRAQLEKALKADGPKVVLASDLTLDWGYSKVILEEVAQNTASLILLTERPSIPPHISSNVQQLWQWYKDRPNGVALETAEDGNKLEQVHGTGQNLAIRIAEKQPLTDGENQQHQQYVATQRQLQASLGLIAEASSDDVDDNVDDESSSSSSDESDDEQQGRVLNVSAALGHGNRNKMAVSDEDLGINVLVRKKGVHDYDVRNKKGRNAVFPYTHSRKRGDDFGDFIKPEDFLREEEKEVQDEQSLGPSGTLGQKRKWGDANNFKGIGPNKRQHLNRQDKEVSKTDGEDRENDDSDDSDEDGGIEPEGLQGPAKLVYSTKNVSINARIAFVDFAGLHDQRALQMLIPLIGPKKLILTSGTKEETNALASDCRNLLGIKIVGAEDEPSTEVFTPIQGQIVDASVDTNAWIVKLSRSLAKNLHWQNVKNMSVVTLQAQLKGETPTFVQQEDPKTKKQKVEKNGENDLDKPENGSIEPILDILPPDLAASTRTVTQPIHVGDMRLADLRHVMNTNGHAAEFRGEGTLLVDGVIAVKKLSSGKIIVEGVPVSSVAMMTARASDSFTQVKRKIYEGLAVVTAG